MTRPPLLLAHAALGSRSQFDPLTACLEADFTVLRPDFDGHGAAPMPAGPMRVASLADNLLACLDAHAVDAVGIVGHSLGGYVGLYLCRHAPHRVLGVHTLGTQLQWDAESTARMGAELDAAVIERKVPKFAAALAARHGAERWREVVTRTREFVAALGAAPDVDADSLAAITQPVRFAVGDRDHLVPVAAAASAAHAVANGQLAVLPRTAHPIETVRAPLLAASVRDFFLD